MGLGNQTYLFMKKFCNNVQFNDVLTLGRQNLYLTDTLLEQIGAKKARFADDIFVSEFGVKNLFSLDYSDFEGADFIYDLNSPVDKSLHARFDVVCNFGTLEHIFDVRVAFENFVNLCKPGGHLILSTPCNNECGHGFYQFSPEFFFSLFSKENGFDSVEIYIAKTSSKGKKFYKCIKPPKGQRLMIKSSSSLTLFALAKKSESSCSFQSVYQSDYTVKWNVAKNKQSNPKTTLKTFLKRFLPGFVYSFLASRYSEILKLLPFNPYLVRTR